MSFLEPVNSLFPTGFSYHPNFISREDENDLIDYINQLPLTPFEFKGFEAKRKTMSFGMDYHFNHHTLTKGQKIPAYFDQLIRKVSTITSVPGECWVELLVTEYPPGSVINWHRDAMPFEIIAGISLHSDCQFKLRPYGEDNSKRRSVLTIPCRARSLYVMKDASRWEWQHSIAPVKYKRYSITLRTLKNPS